MHAKSASFARAAAVETCVAFDVTSRRATDATDARETTRERRWGRMRREVPKALSLDG